MYHIRRTWTFSAWILMLYSTNVLHGVDAWVTKELWFHIYKSNLQLNLVFVSCLNKFSHVMNAISFEYVLHVLCPNKCWFMCALLGSCLSLFIIICCNLCASGNHSSCCTIILILVMFELWLMLCGYLVTRGRIQFQVFETRSQCQNWVGVETEVPPWSKSQIGVNPSFLYFLNPWNWN
jgi:hypothetical protein